MCNTGHKESFLQSVTGVLHSNLQLIFLEERQKLYVACVVSVAENLTALVNDSDGPGNDLSMYLSASELKISINFFTSLKKRKIFFLCPSLS